MNGSDSPRQKTSVVCSVFHIISSITPTYTAYCTSLGVRLAPATYPWVVIVKSCNIYFSCANCININKIQLTFIS